MDNLDSEVRNQGSPRPFIDGLRSAIAASDLSAYGLARAAGFHSSGPVALFEVCGKYLLLWEADMLAVALGIKVDREANGLEPEPRDNVRHSMRPFSDGLRWAFAASGLDAHALGQLSGVKPSWIRHFIKGRMQIRFSTADKLAAALGLKVARDAEVHLDLPEFNAEGRVGVISGALRSAIIASGLSVFGLGKAARLRQRTRSSLEIRLRDSSFGMAEKLTDALGLVLVRNDKGSESKPGINSSKESLHSKLCRSILGARLFMSDFDVACRRGIGCSLNFITDKNSIDLPGADNLVFALGLKMVRDDKVWRPGPMPDVCDPEQPFLAELRSAIVANGLFSSDLHDRLWMEREQILHFIGGWSDISPSTLKVLADSTGLGLDPARIDDQAAEVFTLVEGQPAPDLGRGSQASLGERIGTTSEQEDRPREPNPWDNWDTNICPVHVRKDGHLIVFGRGKGPLKSESAIQLCTGLAEEYPRGFDLPGLESRFSGGRAMISRLKQIDSDCWYAFQTPGKKNGGSYKIGRPDNL